VLISKPPDVAVGRQLVRQALDVGKPCVLAFLGSDALPMPGAPLYTVATLEEAALVASALVRGETVTHQHRGLPPHLIASVETSRAALAPEQRSVYALYCGGTLAHESLWLLRQALHGVTSNLDGTLETASTPGHVVLDLGAEEFTSGRPHPMMDPTVRRQQLLALAPRPEVAVVLCDVILGWGAHADPAGALVAAWVEAQQMAHSAGRQLIGIATVCGAPYDPQGYAQQRQILQEHGFLLAESNARAVRLAIAVVGGQSVERRAPAAASVSQAMTVSVDSTATSPAVPAHLPALFATGPRVINVGLELFAEQYAACGVPVVHVDWRPPAGGDVRLAQLLARLR
jgi:FdrA protein